MKGETQKIYRAMKALHRATLIAMVRWSFTCAGFGPNPRHLFGLLAVNPAILLDRITISEIALEALVVPEIMRPPLATERDLRRRQQTAGLHGLAASL
jgi:hypothetical protein